MASATQGLLSLSILLGLLAIAVNARPGLHFHPCKTLFFISSSSYDPLDQSPNFPLQNPSSSANGGRYLTFFFTEVQELDPKPYDRSYEPIFFDRAESDGKKRHLPLQFSSSVSSRTRDIMSVVGALLFGVGCGALTAATMYLIWSLFAHNRFEFRDSDDDFDDDDDDDDVKPKKMGYVAIPAADAAAPPPAKEVV